VAVRPSPARLVGGRPVGCLADRGDSYPRRPYHVTYSVSDCMSLICTDPRVQRSTGMMKSRPVSPHRTEPRYVGTRAECVSDRCPSACPVGRPADCPTSAAESPVLVLSTRLSARAGRVLLAAEDCVASDPTYIGT